MARSANNANNKTVISVVEEHHTSNGLIRQLDLINMFFSFKSIKFYCTGMFGKKGSKTIQC